MVRRFPEETKIFLGSTVTDNQTENVDQEVPVLSPEFLQTVDFPFITPIRLDLKVGAPIILLRNLDPEYRLYNGTRVVILRMGRNVLKTRVLTGDFTGQKRLIPRIKLTTQPAEFPYLLTRLQFPVRLYFSMTINKSQGQSFRLMGVDLRVPVFYHGQFYVAISRVTDVRGLFLLFGRGTTSKVLNIIYPEVLIKGNLQS